LTYNGLVEKLDHSSLRLMKLDHISQEDALLLQLEAQTQFQSHAQPVKPYQEFTAEELLSKYPLHSFYSRPVMSEMMSSYFEVRKYIRFIAQQAVRQQFHTRNIYAKKTRSNSTQKKLSRSQRKKEKTQL